MPLASGPEDFRSVLATVDREGRRRKLYVHIVGGIWRRARAILAVFLIGFYLAAPFVHINGMPMVRIDAANRHYILFGQVFWPQDFFYFLLFILTAIIGTVALVSLLGRVFCGWLCPHNVFLEMVFRPLERLIEGPAHRRRKNDEHPDGSTRARKLFKWLVFCLVCGGLANTAMALFVGTEAFLWGVVVDPVAHPSAAVFFVVFFFVNLFNFGWFREQTCTIVCPYGRLQSALLDSETLVVGYDHGRGEPRGKKGKAEGDCIDCGLCVQVCPTGIDIRNGSQMECIHCAACIDACAPVMARLGREPGLIRYTSENELAGRPWRILRPRTLLYALVWSVLLTVALVAVVQRPLIEVTRLRESGNVASTLTQEGGVATVRKPVRIAITNKGLKPTTATFGLPVELGGRVLTQYTELPLPANERIVHSVHVLVPLAAFTGPVLSTQVAIRIAGDDTIHRVQVRLRRPDLARDHTVRAIQGTPRRDEM